MKVLLLAALVASISGLWFDSSSENDQWRQSPIHTEYQSGKEYVYKYESQVLTSLPTFTKSHGGVKIISTVKFDFTSKIEGVMQLTESQVLSLNKDVNNPAMLPPTMQLPVDQFTPLPATQATLIKAKLETPIKFRLENGKITSIEINKKETNWSIDLKRSILSMLQVRLQADGVGSNPELPYNKLEQENSTAFDFLEPALDGTCYSAISVQPSPNATDEHQYRVMKTRDPVNCVKVNTVYKVVRPQTIASCNCDANLKVKLPQPCLCAPTAEEYMSSNPAFFKAKTLSEYEIVSEDQKDLLIKSCVQSATYRYEFPNSPDQYLATFSNQTLQLQQQKDTLTIHTGGFAWRDIDTPWTHRVLKTDEEEPMMTSQQIISTLQSQINELESISQQKQRFDEHIPAFRVLVDSMKLAGAKTLESLYKDNAYNTVFRKWKLMVDALAHCNTTVCDTFLMEQMASDNKFPPTEFNTIFMLWASNKVPSPKVLEQFSQSVIPALQKKTTQLDKLAYHHSLLCFGSMVRRYIHSEEMEKKICVLDKDKLMHQKNIDYSRRYEKVIEGRLTNAHTDVDKIAVLKALTNLGSLESLPQLQHLMDKTETNAVRVHAIYAVKNLCFQNRLQVLQTLSPLLMDVNEDSEVRMAAFIFYMLCDPSTTQLHRLIEQEPDLDLKTFFVQTLRNELRASGPSNVDRRQKAKMVLSKVKAFHMSPESGSSQIRYGLRPDSDGEIRTSIFLTNQTSSLPRTGAIRDEVIVRGTAQHSVEIGFRAEALESIMEKLTEQTPMSQRSYRRPNISVLKSLWQNRALLSKDVNPSLTLSFKVAGQEVAFVHVDKTTLYRALTQSLRNSEFTIPIRVFLTYIAPQEQIKMLQPNGMWLTNERVSAGVIDLDGEIRVALPTPLQKIPTITFHSENMLRFEQDTAIVQHVNCGFGNAGVASIISSGHILSGGQSWNVLYSLEHRNITINFGKPTQELMKVKLDAFTYTFYSPERLPVSPSQRRTISPTPVTADDDSQRLVFAKHVDAFNSVDLFCKVEGDIYVPELYTYVRDRINLLPTVFSMKKQHILLTISPAVSSPRNFTFTTALRPMSNEFASSPSLTSERPSPREIPSVEQPRWQGSLFNQLFSIDSDSSSSSSSSSDSSVEEEEIRLALGSVQYFWQARISSLSSENNKTMAANLTSQYNYDEPTIHTVLTFERPPIPGREKENAVSRIIITKTLNPSINQIVSAYEVEWGTKSHPAQQTIKMTEEHTAMYKDNVCYEQTAYGCKDQYGVFYPVWYNQTSLFTSKNTDLVPRVIKLAMPYFMNSANKVWVWPMERTSLKPNQINMTNIYRTNSDMVDVSFTLNHMTYNMSGVYMPFTSKMNEIMNEMPGYPMAQVQPIDQFVPGHRFLNPFFSRDTCVLENGMMMSMDFKQQSVPRSDCEVNLLSDCSKQLQPPIQVTLRSTGADNSNSVQSKVIKAVIGQTNIEVQVKKSTSYRRASTQLRINGQQRSLSAGQQVLVKQNQVTVAIVECSNEQCEIKSSQRGLYVRVNIQRVKIELDNGRARSVCGLCSAHPKQSREQVDYQRSIQLFKDNRVEGAQCFISERTDDGHPYPRQQPCRVMRKHKIINSISNGELNTCVTTDMLTLCSRHCEEKQVRFDVQPARCVSRKEAQKLDLTPTMEGNEMYLQDERILSRMQSSEVKHLKVPISQNCL